VKRPDRQTKLAEARRAPWLFVVTQCDVTSECSTFNKIHCRLAAPVSHRVSKKLVEWVLCGGGYWIFPSPRVNLVVWILLFHCFFPIYLFLTSPGTRGKQRWWRYETTHTASVGSGDSVTCCSSMLYQRSPRLERFVASTGRTQH